MGSYQGKDSLEKWTEKVQQEISAITTAIQEKGQLSEASIASLVHFVLKMKKQVIESDCSEICNDHSYSARDGRGRIPHNRSITPQRSFPRRKSVSRKQRSAHR